ncbi:MAG: recombinase family protein [Cyanobacteria bacterium J06649_11]
MLVGYARHRVDGLVMKGQVSLLKDNGCSRIIKDVSVADNKVSEKFYELQESVRKGDTVVVTELTVFGRAMLPLVELLKEFNNKGIGIISLKDSFSTYSPNWNYALQVVDLLAKVQTAFVKEKTMEGLVIAREQGRFGGRPKGLTDEAQLKAKAVAKMYLSNEYTVREIADELGIAVTSIYNYLRHENIRLKNK